jgi:threonine/homoserine/homoserine lactone efflux protein
MNSFLAQFLQVALFSTPLVLSPGPNNLMMTTHCAQFGYQRTLPSLAGVSAGVTMLFLAVSLGLGYVLTRYTEVHLLLKVTGSAYILYLSYRLFTSNAQGNANNVLDRPITFGQAALLQILNPKIWLLACTATSAFLPFTGNMYHDAAFLSLTLGAIFFPCNSIWAVFGLVLRRFLSGKKSWRIFNRTMGLVTASSVLFIL